MLNKVSSACRCTVIGHQSPGSPARPKPGGRHSGGRPATWARSNHPKAAQRAFNTAACKNGLLKYLVAFFLAFPLLRRSSIRDEAFSLYSAHLLRFWAFMQIYCFQHNKNGSRQMWELEVVQLFCVWVPSLPLPWCHQDKGRGGWNEEWKGQGSDRSKRGGDAIWRPVIGGGWLMQKEGMLGNTSFKKKCFLSFSFYGNFMLPKGL